VLIEGFKNGGFPKLEVWRADVGKPLLWPDWPGIEVIACDDPGRLPPIALPAAVEQRDLADVASIADCVLRRAVTR